EYNMVRFLEREGYDVTYATDVDTHENPDLLLSHKGFLSVGHDEYWSKEMRDHVEAARDSGIHLGFFAANVSNWQIRFEPSNFNEVADRTITCYKDGNLDPIKDNQVTFNWRSPSVNRPEAQMIGVMYRFDPVNADIVIENNSHWVFDNTGLKSGDHLPGLLGYEVDQIFDSSPAGIVRLAHSPYLIEGVGHFSDMTIYTAPSDAFVFATGSMQWNWGLDDYGAPQLRPALSSFGAQQMTRNILNHMRD
ncbi:MAG: N,N-dimethylformamidase beta subunit family domain-containing protein, partial [Bdellovibrionia bacterium]